jgi:hypothetical protein
MGRAELCLAMVDRQHFQPVFGVKSGSRRICAIHVAEVYADIQPFRP